jgi:hypothetical protein
VSLGLALGKYFLCRVPEEMRSANNFAFGKAAVSCSELYLHKKKEEEEDNFNFKEPIE